MDCFCRPWFLCWQCISRCPTYSKSFAFTGIFRQGWIARLYHVSHLWLLL